MLTFYNVADVPNKLNKTLTTLGSTGYYKATDGNSETQTTYVLDSSMPENANYVYDSELGKYFFIVEVEHHTAKRIVIHCALDALQTYKSRLTGMFYFVRGAAQPTEMEDSNYPLGDYIKTETYNFDDWDTTFLKNTDIGPHFMLRTAVGKAKSQYKPSPVPISIGSNIRYQNYVWTVVANPDYPTYDICPFTLQDIGVSIPPSGISVRVGSILKYDDTEWVITSINGPITTSSGSIYYGIDWDINE